MENCAVPIVSASKIFQPRLGETRKAVKHACPVDLKPPPASSEKECRQFQRDLVVLIPRLRAFSRSLCSRRDIADDLAQDALMKAWRARDSFKSETNLKAWLFTILRNTHFSYNRRAWREAQLDAGLAEQIEAPNNEQEWSAELRDTARALHTLPDAQRDAVILVGAGGFTYKVAAKLCNTNSGTMKSRVARGRSALLNVLNGDVQIKFNPSERWIEGANDILERMEALSFTVSARANSNRSRMYPMRGRSD